MVRPHELRSCALMILEGRCELLMTIASASNISPGDYKKVAIH